MSLELIIYASPIPATYLIGPAIAKFIQQYPNCQVQLKSNDQQEFLKNSYKDSFDLGVFDISGFEKSTHLECELLLSSTANLCCRTDHPLQLMNKVHASDINRYPLALPSVLPEHVNHELNRVLDIPIENGRCRANLCYDSLVSVRHTLIRSDTIALAPSLALTQSLSNELKALDIEDWPLIEAEFGIITRKRQPQPPHCTAFIEQLFEVAEGLKR